MTVSTVQILLHAKSLHQQANWAANSKRNVGITLAAAGKHPSHRRCHKLRGAFLLAGCNFCS